MNANTEKTLMYLELMSAQSALLRLSEHGRTVSTLESLIGNAYLSGNERMEEFYRGCLDLYEKTRYDL